MSRISKAFLTGLAAILPILITVYVLIWVAGLAERAFGSALRLALTEKYYWRGMGLAAGIVLTTLLGLSLHAWIVRKCFGLGERLLHRMPIIKIVYGAARDLIAFFSETKGRALAQPVVVTTGENIRQVGFVTREDFAACPAGLADPDTVAVFVPNSYELGGATLLVPRSSVRPIDMPFYDAMRFALTAGLSTGPRDGPAEAKDSSQKMLV